MLVRHPAMKDLHHTGQLNKTLRPVSAATHPGGPPMHITPRRRRRIGHRTPAPLVNHEPNSTFHIQLAASTVGFVVDADQG